MATAHGWSGTPASRATMRAPGLARRYGPNGPSGLTTGEAPSRPMRASSSESRAASDRSPSAGSCTEPESSAASMVLITSPRKVWVLKLTWYRWPAQPMGGDRGGEVVLVPERQHDLLLVDRGPWTRQVAATRRTYHAMACPTSRASQPCRSGDAQR